MTIEQINEVIRQNFDMNETNIKEYLNEEDKIVRSSIAYVLDNGLTNLCIACEELAELEQAITKMIRGKGNKLLVEEEFADVLLGFKFVNEVYGVNIQIDDISFDKMSIDEKTPYYILKCLNNMQDAILSAIIYDDKRCLENDGYVARGCLELLKEIYGLNEEDIFKIRKFKIYRLKNRIDTKTQI